METNRKSVDKPAATIPKKTGTSAIYEALPEPGNTTENMGKIPRPATSATVKKKDARCIIPAKENPGNIPKKKDAGHGYLKFWTVRFKNVQDEKVFSKIEVDQLLWVRLLLSFGFRRLDLPDGGFHVVYVEKNIVKQVQPHHIVQRFKEYLKTLPEKIDENVKREDLERLAIEQTEKLFNKANKLIWLEVGEPLQFNHDTKTESFVYYQNGYVKCEKGKSFVLMPYDTLCKVIWSEQIIPRNFKVKELAKEKTYDSYGFFAKFVWNVSGKTDVKCSHLVTLVGYLLHDFKEGALKAVVLTDGKISESNEGRTGKTLLGKAISKIRNVTELNGKDFNTNDRFKYSKSNPATQIIFLNDARAGFNLEPMYNDITEGITVEKKGQDSFNIKVKILITTNKALTTNGASSRARVLEFEFSDHYNENFSPENEFLHWFFRDWDGDQWNDFDNFMMDCLSTYLNDGVLASDPVNLDKKKLMDSTCKGFFDMVEAGEFKPNEEFCMQDKFALFEQKNPDYDFGNSKTPTKTFASWVRKLPNTNGKFRGLIMTDVRKNNGLQYWVFK